MANIFEKGCDICLQIFIDQLVRARVFEPFNVQDSILVNHEFETLLFDLFQLENRQLR